MLDLQANGGKEFRKHLRALSGRRSAWQVYRDFCELAYCALAKPYQPSEERRDALEARYMETVGGYKREEVDAFPAMLALTATALGDGPADFLGTIYEDEGFTDKKYGAQFWTPWNLAQAMALMVLGRGEASFEDKPILTLAEPCCGSGRLVLAFAEAVIAEGIDPGKRLWIEATDVDRLCQQMTFIQMACCGLAGTVRHGNSLSMETWETALTPAGCMLLSTDENARQAVQDLHTPAEREPEPLPMGQLSLDL